MVFMCILVLVAAVALCFRRRCSEISIRTAGYILQVLGMLFAIRGLLRVRTHFGQPQLRQLFVNWLKRFPIWKRSVVMGVDTAHIAIAGMHARAEVWTPDNQDQPIEKRIEGIIRDLDRIRIKPGEHDKFVEELR